MKIIEGKALLSGSGNFLEALKDSRVLEMVLKYSDKAVKVDTTLSGGWIMYEVVE